MTATIFKLMQPSGATRRATFDHVPQKDALDALVQGAGTRCHPLVFVYRDSEGDIVLIKDSQDVAEAARDAHQSGAKSIKLHLHRDRPGCGSHHERQSQHLQHPHQHLQRHQQRHYHQQQAATSKGACGRRPAAAATVCARPKCAAPQWLLRGRPTSCAFARHATRGRTCHWRPGHVRVGWGSDEWRSIIEGVDAILADLLGASQSEEAKQAATRPADQDAGQEGGAARPLRSSAVDNGADAAANQPGQDGMTAGSADEVAAAEAAEAEHEDDAAAHLVQAEAAVPVDEVAAAEAAEAEHEDDAAAHSAQAEAAVPVAKPAEPVAGEATEATVPHEDTFVMVETGPQEAAAAQEEIESATAAADEVATTATADEVAKVQLLADMGFDLPADMAASMVRELGGRMDLIVRALLANGK